MDVVSHPRSISGGKGATSRTFKKSSQKTEKFALFLEQEMGATKIVDRVSVDSDTRKRIPKFLSWAVTGDAPVVKGRAKRQICNSLRLYLEKQYAVAYLAAVHCSRASKTRFPKHNFASVS